MSTLARLIFVSAISASFVVLGCSKEKEEPQAVPLPSSLMAAPVEAKADPAPAQAAAESSAAAETTGAAAEAVAAPAPAEAPKPRVQQSIDGCCLALTNMTRDAKESATVKSKATAAAAMCQATAKLVKDGKASRSSALAQIKATMAGKAPGACN